MFRASAKVLRRRPPLLLPAAGHFSQTTFCYSSSSSSSSSSVVRIGCASGFWGDTPTASDQLIRKGNVDYLIFDYLSELTMSLLTAAQAKKPELGFAPDFVKSGIGPYLRDIKDKGIRVVTNAGGINTASCVAALEQACKASGVQLKIASVNGDNMIHLREKLLQSDAIRAMGGQERLPKTVHSMTAYFGATPIVRALEMGADIVVTGRTADSALALGPLMHEFKWTEDDLDLLSAGSLAGHLIECGGQSTGGLFTDWESVPGYENLGFPVIEMSPNGEMVVTKPPGTGGLVNQYTVAEQMLYEIGDPENYVLPDVNCDFSRVEIRDTPEGVLVRGARGKPATDTYKVSATYMDGFKATGVFVIVGGKAAEKGRKTGQAILNRCSGLFQKMGLKDFDRTHLSILGAEDSFGANARSQNSLPREAVVWMSVQHRDKKALDIWAREIASAGTGMAPGLCGMVGGRPKATPCLKLFSFLYPKENLPALVKVGDLESHVPLDVSKAVPYSIRGKPAAEESSSLPKGPNAYTLKDLAYARSGDKGNSCNIGVIARHPSYLPYLKQHLTAESVAEYFSHYFESAEDSSAAAADKVTRFDVPGINALNFLLEDVLDGGGIASMRPDPLGKAFAQMLLDFKMEGMPSKDQIEKDF